MLPRHSRKLYSEYVHHKFRSIKMRFGDSSGGQKLVDARCQLLWNSWLDTPTAPLVFIFKYTFFGLDVHHHEDIWWIARATATLASQDPPLHPTDCPWVINKIRCLVLRCSFLIQGTQVLSFFDWLVCRLIDWLILLMVCLFANWFPDWLFSCLNGWHSGSMVGWLTGWMVG